MKKVVNTLIIVASIFISLSSSAQGIINNQGDTIASIDESGIITNTENEQIGQILSTGTVLDATGQTLGSIVGNEIKNSSGNVVATLVSGIENELQLKNTNNKILAKIQMGIVVTNATGEVLINFSDPSPGSNYLSAYYYFFYSGN